MEQLPSEIVQTIAREVDRRDILEFRLTCRSFAVLGLERQFQVVCLSFFRKSFDNLIRIAEHPAYRNYVLSVEYKPEITSNPYPQVTLGGYVLNNHYEAYDPVSRSAGDKAYRTHLAYWDDQNLMEVTGFDFMVLQSAVSRFPNLREIKVQEMGYGSDYLPPGTEPTAHGQDIDYNRIYGQRTLADTRQLTSILSAVKLAKTPLSKLTCDSFDFEIFGGNPNVPSSKFNDFVPDPAKDLGFPLVRVAFENLTYVDLTTRFRGDTYSKPLQHHLGTALRAAHSLETLSIRASLDGDGRNRSPWHLHWEDLIGASTWPSLKSLSVTSVKIKEPDFISFFPRHPSLQEFKLDTAFAQEGDWAEVLQAVKPHWRQLRRLELAGAWGAANWIEILDQHDGRYVEVLNLSTAFGIWAQREAGADNAAEVIKRFIRRPFDNVPLKGEQDLRASWARLKLAIGEQIDDILHKKGRLLLADSVIGWRWRYRNAYYEYDDQGCLIDI